MYYYNIITKSAAKPIKIDIGRGLDLTTAIEIMRRTYGKETDTIGATLEVITNPDTIRAIDETLTISLPDRIGTRKYNYYVPTDTDDTILVTLVDADAGQTANIKMPRIVMDHDASGNAAANLLLQIAEEFCASEEGKTKYPDGMRWSDIVNIPTAFLSRYGVTIEPVETSIIIEISINRRITGFTHSRPPQATADRIKP